MYLRNFSFKEIKTTSVKKTTFLLVIAATIFSGCKSQKLITKSAENPFIRHLYTADPSARVFKDGRLYVYASHDVDPPRGCDLMDQYHVFSTDNMVNWKDHGEILRASQVPLSIALLQFCKSELSMINK